jgi:hypothetical protein
MAKSPPHDEFVQRPTDRKTMALTISIGISIAISLVMAYVIGEIRRETSRLAALKLQRVPRARKSGGDGCGDFGG